MTAYLSRCRRRASERHTAGSGSSLSGGWSTPLARDGDPKRGVSAGRGGSPSLAEQVAGLFPTPTAHDSKPTAPKALARNTPTLAEVAAMNLDPLTLADTLRSWRVARSERSTRLPLETWQVGSATLPPVGRRPALNPRFVEALMGFPRGWLALGESDDASTSEPSRPSATPSCPSAPRSQGGSSGRSKRGDDGPLRPFFKHFGSKWNLSARLPPPKHSRIVELFAGGAGYSCRHWKRDVLLVDIDPDTVAIWHYLQRATRGDIMALPGTLPTTDIRELGLAREEVLLIQRWLTPSGSITNWRLPPSVQKNRPLHPSSYWGVSVRDRLSQQVELIRHWRVVLGSWEQYIDSGPATWVVDPPYKTQTNNSAYGAGRAPVDFDALGAACRALSGQVLVHEQEGASWLPFEPWVVANTGRTSPGSRGKRQEYLWVNES